MADEPQLDPETRQAVILADLAARWGERLLERLEGDDSPEAEEESDHAFKLMCDGLATLARVLYEQIERQEKLVLLRTRTRKNASLSRQIAYLERLREAETSLCATVETLAALAERESSDSRLPRPESRDTLG